MENLIIKNNSGSENVGSDVLLKVYELALLTNGTLQLSGNIVVPHARQSVLNYFENNFPDLHITLTGLKYIDFADPVVAWHIAKSYDPDGIGITLSDLNSINWLTTSMEHNTSLVSFNELSQFVNLHTVKNGAFYGCTSLSSIDLSNITTIEQDAFRECTSLSNIDLSNVTSIGNSSFLLCSSLANITWPSSSWTMNYRSFRQSGVTSADLTNLTSFESYGACFESCHSLQSVTLNSNITSIPPNTFVNCENLSSIDLSHVTTIGDYAFMNDSSLATVDLLNAISIGVSAFKSSSISSINLPVCTTLGAGAFNECKSVTSITLNSSITSIPERCFRLTKSTSIDLSNVTLIKEYAFEACTNLTTVTLSNSNLLLKYGCFSLCSNLTNIDLSHVVSMENEAFKQCTSLTRIITGSGLTSLGDNVFYNCSGTTEIDLSASTSLTSIPSAAFANSGATKVSIPSSVTSIADWAICPKNGDVSSSRDYYIYATTPPTLTHTRAIVSSGSITMPHKIYVPASTNSTVLNAYKTASVWSNFASVMEEMPTT